MSLSAATSRLRRWQVEALKTYFTSAPRDFLVTATPGAGKTTFALILAKRLRERRLIDRVIVVVPTDHLRSQWADAGARLGLELDPALTNAEGPVRAAYSGYIATYAQVAAHPMLHRARATAKRSLVILDEVHHAGDGLSWGEAISVAFSEAQRRLCMTGTPFRTKPEERIPFIRYEQPSDDEVMSVADYTYGYREALRDGVVRPVVFAAYTGTSRWKNSAGDVITESLSGAATKKREETAWRTALNPEGKWIPHVIAAADHRISDLRAAGIDDAAALMLATDQQTAREYAKIVKRVTGHAPVVVLSDDPKSSKKIEAFNRGNERWLVAVRQVSEGVDIARLSVCVWTTSYRTQLFFAQAVGRVVRARSPHEAATVFLPAVRPLLALAAELEAERNHVMQLPVGHALDEWNVDRVESEPGASEFTALDSEAEFAHLLHGGRAVTAAPAAELTADQEDFLGLPGLLSPEQTAQLLAQRDATLRRVTSAARELSAATPAPLWRDAQALRQEISELVRTWAGRSDKTPAQVHVELRTVIPGPGSSKASVDVLEARRDYLLGRVG